MLVDFFLIYSVLLLVLESRLKTFCSRNIVIILGFSCLMAVIALIAVGLTQNQSSPNIKVTQICVCVFVCVFMRGLGRVKKVVTTNEDI